MYLAESARLRSSRQSGRRMPKRSSIFVQSSAEYRGRSAAVESSSRNTGDQLWWGILCCVMQDRLGPCVATGRSGCGQVKQAPAAIREITCINTLLEDLDRSLRYSHAPGGPANLIGREHQLILDGRASEDF